MAGLLGCDFQESVQHAVHCCGTRDRWNVWCFPCSVAFCRYPWCSATKALCHVSSWLWLTHALSIIYVKISICLSRECPLHCCIRCCWIGYLVLSWRSSEYFIRVSPQVLARGRRSHTLAQHTLHSPQAQAPPTSARLLITGAWTALSGARNVTILQTLRATTTATTSHPLETRSVPQRR